MREIKFRAWDKAGKMMTIGSLQFINNDIWVTSSRDKRGFSTTIQDGAGCTLMQFTGLKDKNGQEIYEGDIIQTVADDGTKLSKFQIDWRDGAFRKLRDDGNIYFAESCGVKHTEVIGNIYENPELLEAKS